MVNVVLVESSLTKIPEKLKKIDKIRSYYSRVYGKFYDVLDIRAIPPRERRWVSPKGSRPDVVHRSILSVTDHPLFLMGLVDFYIHTIDDRIFKLSKKVRPPRNYVRFLGLMDKLLKEGWVGPRREDPLIWEVKVDLKRIVGKDVLLLDEDGPLRDPLPFLRSWPWREGTIMVGGFSRGSFSDRIMALTGEKLSLYRGVLSSSTSLSMILTYLYYLEVWL